MAETVSLATTARTLRTHLAALTSAPSTAALVDTVSLLHAEKAALEARLAPLRAGAVKPVNEQEREMVDKEVRKWKKIEGGRRKITREVWNTIKDFCEGKDEVERFKEDWGIEW